MASSVTSQDLDVAAVRGIVDDILADFLAEQGHSAAARRLPSEVAQVLQDFVSSGGKRIRPVLCAVGWHASGGVGLPPMVARVGAALEMFHAFALIHDDVMDRSDSRRGRPTVHRGDDVVEVDAQPPLDVLAGVDDRHAEVVQVILAPPTGRALVR
ncbi:polyprenyl synthetase family protein [Streptomyces sp. NPDC001920]